MSIDLIRAFPRPFRQSFHGREARGTRKGAELREVQLRAEERAPATPCVFVPNEFTKETLFLRLNPRVSKHLSPPQPLGFIHASACRSQSFCMRYSTRNLSLSPFERREADRFASLLL